MRVLELWESQGLAICVDGEGREREVQTDLVEGVSIGDELLVHAGVALVQLPRRVAR